ncbi:hypothetical protein GCM10010515_24840 [Streptomyces fructofermentans]|uniref:Uncharacterized protein n=1 Tax=Streptomyces fructofermentans TaxID=152141 RepID=A0A918NBU8_9ACTN|nr:hypothetical protein GCM10010515_24840 [Streptomyces fructofermentans]
MAAVACSTTKPYWQIRSRRSFRAVAAVSALPQATLLRSSGMAVAEPVESRISLQETRPIAVSGVIVAIPVEGS